MYHLTLSLADRRAIDWVGHRYSYGDDLYRLLWLECQSKQDCDWDYFGDITFNVPENIAWKIQAIIEEDNLSCFSSILVNKLHEFRDRIV